MKYTAAPNDSRYIPFTQSKYDCVPTSISMIMYRHDLPLLPTEELGYHLGLTVPPKDENLLYKPRVSETPPSAYYGTQIQKPEFEPNKVFEKLDIPLKFRPILADEIKSPNDLMLKLSKIEKNNEDATLCFNYSVAHEKPFRNGGHVVVFDRIINEKIRVVDPWFENAKWQLVEPELLFNAIEKHGNKNFGGIWRFVKK